MSGDSYSNRELDEFFRRADERADAFHQRLMARMDVFEANTTTALQRVEKQTTLTNGRVTKLERWQSYVIGFCAGLSLIFMSVIIPIVIKLLV